MSVAARQVDPLLSLPAIGAINQEHEGVAVYDAQDATSQLDPGGEDRE